VPWPAGKAPAISCLCKLPSEPKLFFSESSIPSHFYLLGVFHSLNFSGEIRRVDAPTCAETGEICAICLAELAAQNEEARESGPTEPRFP